MQIPDYIYNRIRSIRVDHLNMTQEQVAEKLGCSQSLICKVERKASFAMLFLLCRLYAEKFNINLNWLFLADNRRFGINRVQEDFLYDEQEIMEDDLLVKKGEKYYEVDFVLE